MHEKLELWMREKQSRLSDKEKQARDRLLIEQGLFEKVYGDDPDEFFWFEVDEQGRERRYKEVPIPVTDEEYQQIRQMVSSTTAFRWTPANLLRIAAGMVLAGTVITLLAQGALWPLLMAPAPAALIYALAEIVDGLKKK